LTRLTLLPDSRGSNPGGTNFANFARKVAKVAGLHTCARACARGAGV